MHSVQLHRYGQHLLQMYICCNPSLGRSPTVRRNASPTACVGMGCFTIKDMAVDYEQETYQHARNKDEYIQMITSKLNAVESLNLSHSILSAGDQTSAHSGLAGAVDWQDEIYQKIKSLKESYLAELNEQHQKFALKFQQQESLPPAQRTEHFEKLKIFVSSLKRVVQILETSKNDVKADWRDKIPDFERNIVNLLASIRSKKIASTESQAQQNLHHPGGQDRSPIPEEPEKHTGTELTTHGHLAQSQAWQKFQHPCGQATSSTEKLCTMLTTAENVSYQPAGVALSVGQDVSISQPQISASTFLAELTSPDGNQPNTSNSLPSKSITKEDPMERLIKLVETIPSKALISAVRDIKSVVRMVDTLAGSEPVNTYRSYIGEDLAATSKCHLLGGNFISQDGSVPALKMKRDFSAICRDVTSETESPAKRQREEANRDLHKEILETNQKLFYTVIGIIHEDDDSGSTLSSNGGGTMVTFSIKTNCLSASLRSQISSGQSPITPLRLLIPKDYPEYSPTIVDKPQVDASKDFEALFAEAWSVFNASIRSVKQPVSLREMARLWDTSVSKMIAEYDEQSGGGASHPCMAVGKVDNA